MMEPPTNALYAQRRCWGISQPRSLLKPTHGSNSSKFRIIPKYSAFPVHFLPWKTAMSNQKWGRYSLSPLHFCLSFGCSTWADLGGHVTVFTCRLKRMNSSSMICKSHYHMPPESSCVAAAASPASVCLALGTKARAHLRERIWSQPSCLLPIVIRMFTDLLFLLFLFHYHTWVGRVFCHMALAEAHDLASYLLLLKLVKGICFKASSLSIHMHISTVITRRGIRAIYYVRDGPRVSFSAY